MIGNKWEDIPNYEDRATCAICNTTKSMDHILTDCNAIARHLVWNQVKEIWPDSYKS
jgi:hypothetical protein